MRLKPVDNPSCGLSRVRPSISLQALKAEVRILVYKTPVFRAQGKAVRQVVVSAAAVQECTLCLGVRAGTNPPPLPVG